MKRGLRRGAADKVEPMASGDVSRNFPSSSLAGSVFLCQYGSLFQML
jgi:hypothetical protein